MVIKKYIVSSMNEAMTRIRYELGKDAVILSQRKIKRPGFKGFFSPKLIEVTAAVEKMAEPKNEVKKANEFESSIDSIKKLMEQELKNKSTKVDIKADIPKETAMSTSSDNELKKEMGEIKDLLSKVLEKEEIIEEDKFISFLKDRDIEEVFIKDIIRDIKATPAFEEKKEILRNYLNKLIKIDTNNLTGTVVFAGPTGVGKTTTIAKIAGKLALVEKKKVGLITIDTYRIGAVEQLKTYAEIMGIALEVVITLKEMEEAIEKLKYCDIILVDTTGRSSKNTMQISELRAFVEKASPDSIYLVMSSIIKNKDIDIILEGYKLLNYDGIIITKLDETSVYGGLVKIIKESNKPIVYVTTGQSVPEDIKKPTKRELLELILGEDSVC
ncbi:flagellar biosynthesis protein FlhF [Clostridium intestinale]|uniref:Flagellar biosynthesis protein FlhF n=1 Tax=Clostridium intestinale URNW TaxID=1294142 RepID=U2Q6G3_9CLOT|nr:flagellar biosynthesis protein FlhF [Clostridium intestinale]ERK31749.1 flagellar biosynthesis regulator FlhF [Clostridium intestinale URNW]